MKTKIVLYLALVLCFALTGCATAKFKVITDKQRLAETHCVVAQVTCMEATPKRYTTFRERHLRMLAVPPRTRWSATFKVNQIIKGSFSESTFTLTDAEAQDDQSPFSHFFFEVGEGYTVGFDWSSHVVRDLAACYQDDLTSWPDKETSGPAAWPRPRESTKVLERRFTRASLTTLGTDFDFAAIRRVIAFDRPILNLRVEELRWLSPVLVIAKVRASGSEYFYVVEKKNGQWTVLNYYLKWIS